MKTFLPSICPKCSNLLEKRQRNKENKRDRKTLGYSSWEVCLSCGFLNLLTKIKKAKRKRAVKAIRKFRGPYKEYIRSKAWYKRRDLYYKSHKKVCEACGSDWRISLHHMSYQNLGIEKDEDLIPLCWKCHGEYHKRHSFKNLKKSSFHFIDQRRQEVEMAEIAKWL